MVVTCIPDYPHRHSGQLIVVGAGPTVWDDLRGALTIMPTARIAVLNHMAGFVRADFIFTAHRSSVRVHMREQRERFGEEVEAHCALSNYCEPYQKVAFYQWNGLQRHRGGSSALVATQMAKTIGFTDIMLAGCPISDAPYVEGYPAKNIVTKEGERAYMRGAIESWQGVWIRAQQAGELEGVRSMSGFTKEILQRWQKTA